MLGLSVGLTAAIWHFGPADRAPSAADVAGSLARHVSFASSGHDIDVRALRSEQVKRLRHKPDVVLLGGDAWQDARADRVPGKRFINLHVPHDHYEDALGLAEALVRHDRLPKDLILGVGIGFLAPPEARSKFDWLSSIPAYQAMARRLGLVPLGYWETYPLRRQFARLSSAALAKTVPWRLGAERLSPTAQVEAASLDIFRPDGSFSPSDARLGAMRGELADRVGALNADAHGPEQSAIDPRGVEALDRLLAYLGVRHVRVHFAFAPYEPGFLDRLQGTPFVERLRQLAAVIRELADRHKIAVAGSFDPRVVGCAGSAFIDAEHASGSCLARILATVTDDGETAATPAVSAKVASRRCGGTDAACELSGNHGTVE